MLEYPAWAFPEVRFGAAYSPETQTWSVIPPAPSSRSGVQRRTVATESGLVTWSWAEDPADRWAAWDAATNTWERIARGPERADLAALVWTGEELVVWGGVDPPAAWRP